MIIMSKKDKKVFTPEEAQRIGDSIGVDWTEVTLEEFCSGLNTELEHGSRYGKGTNVSDDDPIITGQIAKAHLLEFPDYYSRLEEMEREAEAYWQGRSRKLRDL